MEVKLIAERDFGHEGRDTLHFVFPKKSRTEADVNGGIYIKKNLIPQSTDKLEITIKEV